MLDVTSNCVTDVMPLSKLSGLHTLLAANNKITDVSPLRGCHSLTHLHLENNQLLHLDTVLATLKSLRQLTHLNVFLNPCTTKIKGYQDNIVPLLPALQELDGTAVTRPESALEVDFEGLGVGSRSMHAGSSGKTAQDHRLEMQLRNTRQENARLRQKLKTVWELVTCLLKQDYSSLDQFLPSLSHELGSIEEEDEDEV